MKGKTATSCAKLTVPGIKLIKPGWQAKTVTEFLRLNEHQHQAGATAPSRSARHVAVRA